MDFFKRGDVARDVRLMAAQGAIAPRALEQLGLLVLLTGDADADVRETAEATLNRLPRESISAFIARSDVPTEMREFFIGRGIPPGAVPAPDVDEPLVDEDDTEYGPEPVTEEEKRGLMETLSKMTVPQKVKAAIKGTREMRAILVRDSNKMVALAVLSSPRMNDTEVATIARMGSVSEDVLRVIAQNRAWTKNYEVVSALVKNSKTPLALSLNLLSRLNEKDIKLVSINRNVAEPLRIAARKKLVIGD